MLTHATIISRAGTDPEIASVLGVKVHQVRDWRLRNSIPAEHWAALSKASVATLNELAEAAASKRSAA